MMVSSDERREVAENLRKQLRYMRKNNSYHEDADVVDCGNSAYRNIAGSVEPYGNFEKGNYVHIVERLADLIDPTCHMTREFAETELGRVFQGWLCDECMCTADVPDASEPPSYCPNCGARVVDDGNE